MPATYEQGQLMVQLLQWMTMMEFGPAVEAVFADDFDPETATMRDAGVRPVLSAGEVIGTYVKQGLISREFVSDLLWVDGLWSRVAPAARRVREQSGEPRLYENFEALASG